MSKAHELFRAIIRADMNEAIAIEALRSYALDLEAQIKKLTPIEGTPTISEMQQRIDDLEYDLKRALGRSSAKSKEITRLNDELGDVKGANILNKCALDRALERERQKQEEINAQDAKLRDVATLLESMCILNFIVIDEGYHVRNGTILTSKEVMEG